MLLVKTALITYFVFTEIIVETQVLEEREMRELTKKWAVQIGEELYRLSETMTRKRNMTNKFGGLKDKFQVKNGTILIEEIARDLRATMDLKASAVKNISEYAELLAYYRKTDNMTTNETFDGAYRYYDADLIEETYRNESREMDLKTEIQAAECHWWCDQKNFKPLDFSTYQQRQMLHLFRPKSMGIDSSCSCRDGELPDRTRSLDTYRWLPMEKSSHHEDKEVNLELSSIKIATNIYNRDQNILQGVRWSEALDLVFKENLANDPTIKYQYFASPVGYMRHFPAIKWSQEKYDRTYDPRTRSWYTEAMTSPKDIIILLDRSGSIAGQKRKLSAHIVNNILDTLNDNDFVNIYTFTNTTEPLVDCFSETLVQANEENLRLLRESLDVYKIEFAGNITLGFEKAFEILKRFRESPNIGSNCNQAIMLITEGVDYDYKKHVFNYSNWMENTPVRVFTYQLHTNEEDARNLEWIACANKGYFVNISLLAEVREKVLNYMNVMSRPINCHIKEELCAADGCKNIVKQTPIWSYLYIDLADRRYSNWLWRKYEGIRQREVFLDHMKREVFRKQGVFTSKNHVLLQETHEYEKYKDQIRNDFDYMTTVSMPVYGQRDEDIDLIGVAGVDVPIKLMKSLIPHYILGVNGYAFIVTNNGYILMHPDHRPEFERIPKPTFNRVDFLEVEIMDDDNSPREFNESIIKLRDQIVENDKGEAVLNVKYTVDDLKRIVHSKRRYFFTKIGPFRLVIALPDKYGLVVPITKSTKNLRSNGLTNSHNWKVHPEWVYCTNIEADSPEDVVKKCLKSHTKHMKPLLHILIFDADATDWFEKKIVDEKFYTKKYQVKNVFVATQSGLTRWKSFVRERRDDDFQNEHAKAIDEDWYQRTVEENFNKDENMFVYSVPFEISGFEDDTLVTSTSTIFVENKDDKTPVAVVGLQFNLTVLSELFKNITCVDPKCKLRCRPESESESKSSPYCFILDNNAYIIISGNKEHTGRFIGDIKPDLMYHLVNDKVFKSTIMFDYQAICYKPPPSNEKSAGTRLIFTLRRLLQNLLEVTNWALATILFLLKSVISSSGEEFYKSIKKDTIAYEKLQIEKTYPTPCDQQMWLFTLGDKFNSSQYTENDLNVKFVQECPWHYVVEKIPYSNLVFLAVNPDCNIDTTNAYNKTPTPMEITTYNESLPCYIERNNNFTRKIYMHCFNKTIAEDNLNENRSYCGHDWK